MKIDLPQDFNLRAAEQQLVELALTKTGSIVEAADLLGIDRHAVKRRIVKFGIRWRRASVRVGDGHIESDGVAGE